MFLNMTVFKCGKIINILLITTRIHKMYIYIKTRTSNKHLTFLGYMWLHIINYDFVRCK